MTTAAPSPRHPAVDYVQRVGMLFLVGVVVEWVVEHLFPATATIWNEWNAHVTDTVYQLRPLTLAGTYYASVIDFIRTAHYAPAMMILSPLAALWNTARNILAQGGAGAIVGCLVLLIGALVALPKATYTPGEPPPFLLRVLLIPIVGSVFTLFIYLVMFVVGTALGWLIHGVATIVAFSLSLPLAMSLAKAVIEEREHWLAHSAMSWAGKQHV